MVNRFFENESLGIHSLQFKAMGSPCTIHLQGERSAIQSILESAKQEVLRLEKKYSRYREDSVVSLINATAAKEAIAVDAETAGLLNYVHVCFEMSDGMFDVTSGVLRKVWDFKQNTLPTETDIAACLKDIGWKKVQWDGERIRFERSGIEIDFGGVVKEFSADRVAQYCRDQGVTAGLIELGGDISIVGPKFLEGDEREPWLIGIRHPQTGDAMASIPLFEGGVATSGSYERFIKVNGKRYCHILNPQTGWPVEGVASVSVVAPQCLVSGSLSTIAMLKGHQAAQWLDEQGASYLLLMDNGEIKGTLQG